MTSTNVYPSPRWLQHDFSPWANRYVYWLKTPLGVLIAALVVSLVCGFFVASQGLMIAAGAAVVIVLGIAWPWLGLRGVSCDLQFAQRRTREGQPVTVTATIVNRWPWPVWGLEIERGFFAAATGEDASDTVVALARVGGWSRSEFQWEYVPSLRGSYPLVAPRLATGFPFGLWKAARPINVGESLLVWPQTCPLDWFSLPSGAQRWLGAASQQTAGSEGERSGVRPWREGDTLRSVHWALTARHNRFIVCERQGTAQSQATVVVDTTAEAHVGVGAHATLEWSLRIAASVGELLLSQGTVVTLILGDNSTTFTPGVTGSRRMLDAIARFDPLAQDASLKSRPLSDNSSTFLVSIGTDRLPASLKAKRNRQMQRIELSTAAFQTEQAKIVPIEWSKSAIIIDDAKMPLEQLARRWRRQSAEVLRGA